MIEITLTTLIFCCIASYLAGILDSVAGGGGLVTMPAMLLSGIPPHATLGTNKFASTFGTSMSLFAYARNHLVEWRMAPLGIVASLIGSWVGSLFALYLDPAVMGKVMIMLLPVGMIITLIPKKELSSAPVSFHGPRFWFALGIVGFAVGWYDGFFGPGAGSFFIIAFHWILGLGLIQASATAKVFNLASNVGALVAFLWHGEVLFMLAVPMALASIAGNWTGSRLAIRNGAGMVRRFLFISLSLLMASLIYKYFFS